MRLPAVIAALLLTVALAAAAISPPVGGAQTPPTPGYFAFLPVLYDPPLTATPTATPTVTPPPTATPTRAPSLACAGDEAMTFAPNSGATGLPLDVAVTSARPSVNVGMQVAYGGAGVALIGPRVDTGGKGFIWTWTFTPTLPGWYNASFFVNGGDFCAGASVQVSGAALPTATPTATPLPTATPTPTRTPSAACAGDEEMSFDPNPGATGSPLDVSVTSARASVYVAMQAAYGGAGVALTGPAVSSGGKGYIWTWTFTPYQPGWYTANFYVNNTDFCAGGAVQVQGTAVATPTPSRTPTRTVTPPPAPSATPTTGTTPPPAGVEWDWRLTFLRIGISGASVAPGQQYWRVTKGVFQDWNEGGGSAAIYVDILDQNGNRVDLSPEGTVVGMVRNGGDIPLVWGAKPPWEYPVNSAMYEGLGSYTIWLTLYGLPSERVSGMGLCATDPEGNLIPEPGHVHCNYLFTFRRTTRSAITTIPAPNEPACTPNWRAWRSPLGKYAFPGEQPCDQAPRTPQPPYRGRPGQ